MYHLLTLFPNYQSLPPYLKYLPPLFYLKFSTSINILIFHQTNQTWHEAFAFKLLSGFLRELFIHIHPEAFGATPSNSCGMYYLKALNLYPVEG